MSQVEKRVLIVDDEFIHRMMFEAAVKGEDRICIHAENGQEAIDRFLEDECDLVLMDLSMPVMGGLEAIERIRAIDRNVPIVVVTGVTDPMERYQAFYLGTNAILAKPFKAERLRRIADELLGVTREYLLNYSNAV